MTTKVPDTITSWVVSAFAVSDQSGFGVAPTNPKLKVFRPFFASLNLPYSVKRGEKVAIQTLVFNYMERPQTVTVTLKANSGFEFVEKSDRPRKNSKDKMSAFNTRVVKVPAGGSEAVFFPIRPKKIGDVMLEVEARGQLAADRLRKPLLVEPEGFRVSGSKPVALDLSKKASLKETLKADLPIGQPSFVVGSARIKVDIIGDVMAPVMKNIDDLVQMPYGCGEQNMVNFVPNIVVMKYLGATQRLKPELKEKATTFMEAGYQRELQYKRSDNSFSAFGESDDAGSTWLTAFVVRSFHQAKPYITVDDEIIKKSKVFLKELQNPDGEYDEKHKVHSTYLAGGAGEGGVPLTAYVVATMYETGDKDPAGIRFLESKLSSIRKPYTLALVTYALQLAKSKMRDRAWALLQKQLKQEDGMTFLAEPPAPKDPEKPWYWWSPPPADVEMTAYALHTYLLRGQDSRSLPIVRWLASKRNGQGGWASTQDTVVALAALGNYGEKAYSPNFDVDIKLKNGRTKAQDFKVDPDNALILQTYVARDVRVPVDLEAKGKGVVFAQMTWNYNLKDAGTKPAFNCTARDLSKGDEKNLVARLCCNYNRGGETGMAVLEAEALSGFEFDEEHIGKLTEIKGLQRTELSKGNTQANVYFESMDAEQKCFNLKSGMTGLVGEHKPAQVRIYDYYEPQKRVGWEFGDYRWTQSRSAST